MLALSPRFSRMGNALSCISAKSAPITTVICSPSRIDSPTTIPSTESATSLALLCKRHLSTTPRVDGKGGMLASVHWTLERAFSVVTLAAVPVAFWFCHPVTDSFLALVTVIHTHWGLEAVARDYLCRPLIMNKPVSPMLGKIGLVIVYLISILTLAACVHFNFNDVGLTKAIKMYWTMNWEREILFALLNSLFISEKKMYFHNEVVHELAIVDNPNETCACSRDRGYIFWSSPAR